MLEQKVGHKIKLVIAMVYPPGKKIHTFPTQVAGMSPCYIARDTECIEILRCEIIEKFSVHDDSAVCSVLEGA